MSIEEVGVISSIVGSVAVVLTLFFLAYQVNRARQELARENARATPTFVQRSNARSQGRARRTWTKWRTWRGNRHRVRRIADNASGYPRLPTHKVC